jgi:hypothetical protein
METGSHTHQFASPPPHSSPSIDESSRTYWLADRLIVDLRVTFPGSLPMIMPIDITDLVPAVFTASVASGSAPSRHETASKPDR